MTTCERCDRSVQGRRFRCACCKRLVCSRCCERIDRTQGQRRVWCTSRDEATREPFPVDDCNETAKARAS